MGEAVALAEVRAFSQSHHIGRCSPAEWHEFTDPDTGRTVTQLTAGEGNSYPLYYTGPSVTSDGRYLVFHSERTGWVQLYRLDLRTGQIGQLTDGRTRDAGWAVWCEYHLRGIYNHLSALNPTTDEVFYFQGGEIRATRVATFDNRLVTMLPRGRMPVGQTSFSPDGSLFAFIHVDEKRYKRVLADREALEKMGLSNWDAHQNFRNLVGECVLAVADARSGRYHEVITKDFLFHRVQFLDDHTLLVNHPHGCMGMWAVKLDGGNIRQLRPAEAQGSHGVEVCHQVVTDRGIYYDAVGEVDGEYTVYVGRFDHMTDTFEEVRLPCAGYVHIGNDPAGKLLFLENAGGEHALLSVHYPCDPERFQTRLIRKLLGASSTAGQRYDAHPFLTPDRKWLVYTDLARNRFRQVFRVNVEDMTDLDDSF